MNRLLLLKNINSIRRMRAVKLERRARKVLSVEVSKASNYVV